MIGNSLGPYQIVAKLGEGGMGEVYRGRDTRLERIVAIKVLASSLAADVPARERFEREAKAISSLNHPNICALYDVGRERPSADEAPVDFLVMEYVEGETLAARLARGPSRATRNAALSRGDAPADASTAPTPTPAGALPPMTVEEALAVAIQIAGALDRAPRQGIVHRDLKPGNVMVVGRAGASAPAATVKLLDFGLARLTRPGGGADANEGLGRGLVSLADLSMPTVSSPLTMKGTILGTLQYMSPEQLEGKDVDARADIFAFGGVLYEMLTGRRPFEGKSQASLIGAILDHQPPPVTAFQPVTPPMLDEIVARCLAKDPDDRWQSARDLKRQLEWVAAHRADSGTAAAAVQAPRASAAGRALSLGAALLAGAVIAGGAVAWTLRPTPAAPGVVARFAIDLPEDQAFTRTGRHVIALSPDGTNLVYVANQQLYLRKMGELTAVPIVGTEKSNPAEPIFSPDGQWVAFWSHPELKKVPIAGGTPVTLAAVDNPFGGSWIGDRILLGQNSPRGVVEVPANGGPAKLLVGVDASKAELAYGPQLIGGGRAVLFTLRTGQQPWDESPVVVHELAAGRRTTVVDAGADARVLSTGHLAYVRNDTLFAIPFDDQRMVVTGSAVPMLPGVQASLSGAAQVTLSASGAMAAVSAAASDRDIVWLTRQGQRAPAASVTRTLRSWFPALALSPDGTRAAAIVEAGGSADAWVATLTSNTFTRMTFAGAGSPVWTPDGSRLCFVWIGEAFCQAADGRGKPVSLFKSPGMNALEFSPDGSRLVFAGGRRGADGDDIMIATLGPPLEVRPLIKTTFAETFPAISPDGRWIAYTSYESGRPEVYVRPFPDVEQGRWQVSTDEGTMPRWAKNGRELMFRRGSDLNLEFWVSAIQPGASFIAGRPTQIASGVVGASNAYDVAADGRLLVTMPAGGSDARSSRIVVVQNWFDELKARVPAAARRD